MFKLKRQDLRQKQLITKFPSNPDVLKRMERAFQLAGRNEMVRQIMEQKNTTQKV